MLIERGRLRKGEGDLRGWQDEADNGTGKHRRKCRILRWITISLFRAILDFRLTRFVILFPLFWLRLIKTDVQPPRLAPRSRDAAQLPLASTAGIGV